MTGFGVTLADVSFPSLNHALHGLLNLAGSAVKDHMRCVPLASITPDDSRCGAAYHGCKERRVGHSQLNTNLAAIPSAACRLSLTASRPQLWHTYLIIDLWPSFLSPAINRLNRNDQ